MPILFTAFGPFDGRAENASSLALAGLKRQRPALRTRVFPVDSVVAPQRLNRALREIRPDAVVLLGEAAGSRHLRLETTACNLLDFTIPDIAGRQPRGLTIADGPEFLPSTLPLDRIRRELLRLGIPAEFSDHAGRYLCNQLFFRLRHRLEADARAIPAGFIHLPLAADLPTETAVRALVVIADLLAEKTGIKP